MQELSYLNEASQGNTVSEYHLEAGIATEHAWQKFPGTNWKHLYQQYERLHFLKKNPIVKLNFEIGTCHKIACLKFMSKIINFIVVGCEY